MINVNFRSTNTYLSKMLRFEAKNLSSVCYVCSSFIVSALNDEIKSGQIVNLQIIENITRQQCGKLSQSAHPTLSTTKYEDNISLNLCYFLYFMEEHQVKI